jgi:hypothetical protein
MAMAAAASARERHPAYIRSTCGSMLATIKVVPRTSGVPYRDRNIAVPLHSIQLDARNFAVKSMQRTLTPAAVLLFGVALHAQTH